MTVSVVIPTFNRAAVLSDGIASVLGQTFQDFELLVVDDGSTDDTEGRVKRFQDPRVRYLRLPGNRGASAARNAGIRASTAPLIAFLDSDDLWKPTKLERQVAAFMAHPAVGAMFSDAEKQDGDIYVPSFVRGAPVFSGFLSRPPSSFEVLVPRKTMLECLLQELPIRTSALAVRRQLLDDTGLFDEKWPSGQDWELLIRLAKRTQFAYLDETLAVLRVLPSALHRRKAEVGDRAMLALLRRELATLSDADLKRAARQGISTVSQHLALYYIRRGRRTGAFGVQIRAFLDSGDSALLLRAAGAYAPEALRRWGGRVLRAVAGP